MIGNKRKGRKGRVEGQKGSRIVNIQLIVQKALRVIVQGEGGRKEWYSNREAKMN